jgi:hypothetical protein
LGLEEVSGILRKMNLDKRAADRSNVKREHKFFLSRMGAKSLWEVMYTYGGRDWRGTSAILTAW